MKRYKYTMPTSYSDEHLKSKEQYNITVLLVGVNGSGKSATGNTLLKREVFETGIGTIPTTTEVSNPKPIAYLQNYKAYINVVDTPSLSALDDLTIFKRNAKEKSSIIQKSSVIYAVVISIGRFTQDERDIIKKICYDFHFRNRLCLIFTRKEELCNIPKDGSQRNPLDVWLDSTPTLKRIIEKQEIPYIALKNSIRDEKDQEQVDMFFSHLIKLVEKQNSLQERCLRCFYFTFCCCCWVIFWNDCKRCWRGFWRCCIICCQHICACCVACWNGLNS